MTIFVSKARLRELGDGLRRIRENRGLNGQELATKLHWTTTMLSRIETGKRAPSPMEIALYSGMCGVAGGELHHLLRLAGQPDDYRLVAHKGVLPDELSSVTFHESTAHTIESFHPLYIPPILQTEDYARAVIEADGRLDPDRIDEHVQARLARHAVLTRIDPARCAFYIHENALRMPVAEPPAMRKQILHLLFAGTRPQCDIRVIPASAGATGMAANAFDIYGYPDGMPVIHLQDLTTSLFIEAKPDLRLYRSTLNRIASAALNEDDSRIVLNKIAADYGPSATPDRD